MISRRMLIAGVSASLALPSAARANAARVLKISHQFPSGSSEEGDFRDRLCQKFAQEVEARSKGALRVEVYANSSLMAANAQFPALRKGTLEMSLYPLAYAGTEEPRLNIGLMPCLVMSYEQGAIWKVRPIGAELTKLVEGMGLKIICWIWQAGGIASRARPIRTPQDVSGMKIRGGSREMDQMFSIAGAQTSAMPSNEIYRAMKNNDLDAALTSSTSLISFKLEEHAQYLTTARTGSFWFMFEPLLMSKLVFDSLPLADQMTVLSVGEELEAFAMSAAQIDDVEVARIYTMKRAETINLSTSELDQWRGVAEISAWKSYAAASPDAARLLSLAKNVE